MKTLTVITGPTASGKTALALELAKRTGMEIISADSRQIYKDIPIGTAAPSREERAAVPHHLVGFLNLEDYYSASCFERDVLNLLLSERNFIMCGGSMMYVDAVVNGIDEIPTISTDVRDTIAQIKESEGKDGLLSRLKMLDPVYYEEVDRKNLKRVAHALEIIFESGKQVSELRTGQKKKRPFAIKTFAIDLPREVLFERINRRVDLMIDKGLEEEARRVYAKRHLNSLNTVGYKELFLYFDGVYTREEAIEKIKRNTRVYAKKQLTWLKKNHDVIWLDGRCELDEIINQILCIIK